ncbi:putative minor capsid protein [Pectobacterium phage Q19]|uniref:Minor capsid protein n=1 Tax=Pectobacterium phage Q19 TaxID=2500576 RepID=A0A678ZP16_9CAUD|nr:putative minor capsid protein [Pectobacterium phage Q19]
MGQSYKLTLDELSGVTDWSQLKVDGVAFTRRTNTLYLKGEELGNHPVHVSYEGLVDKHFILNVI